VAREQGNAKNRRKTFEPQPKSLDFQDRLDMLLERISAAWLDEDE